MDELFEQQGEGRVNVQNKKDRFARHYREVFRDVRTQAIQALDQVPDLSDEVFYKRVAYADFVAILTFVTSNDDDQTVVDTCIDLYDTVLQPDWAPTDDYEQTVSALDYLNLVTSAFPREAELALREALFRTVLHYTVPPSTSALIAVTYIATALNDPALQPNDPPPLVTRIVTNYLSTSEASRDIQALVPDIPLEDGQQGEQTYCETMTHANPNSLNLIEKKGVASTLWQGLVNDENVVIKLFIDPVYLRQLRTDRRLDIHGFTEWASDLQGVYYESKMYRDIIPTFDAPWFVLSRGFGRCPKSVINNAELLRKAEESFLSTAEERGDTKYQIYTTLFNAYPKIVIDFLALETFGNSDLHLLLHDLKKDRSQLSVEDWRGIVYQIIHALAILEQNGVCHNDLHTGNVRVKREPFTCMFVGRDGVRRGYSCNYRIGIFDWDRSYSEQLGANPMIDGYAYNYFGSYNAFGRMRDLFTLAYRMWAVPYFANIFRPYFGMLVERSVNRHLTFSCDINDLTSETRDYILDVAQTHDTFIVNMAGLPLNDVQVFTTMFAEQQPVWFRGRLHGRRIHSVLFDEAEQSDGSIDYYYYPNVEMENWTTMAFNFEKMTRILPRVQEDATYTFGVGFPLA